MKNLFSILLILCISFAGFSQKSNYKIKMKIDGMKESPCYLINYFGQQRYYKDTAQFNNDGLVIFEKAIDNASPAVEVKSRRIGGATYQVPIEVPRGRRFYLASQWIINAAISRSGKPMSEKLAAELISAANGEGGAIKKKDDTHRMAEANKAFSHFRF